MKRGDVCITGIGAATPLGTSYPAIAASLLGGKSGVRKVTGFPVDDHPSQMAAAVGAIPCPEPFTAQEFLGLPKTEQLMLWCAANALHDAGWWARRREVR